jgi:hypothetical protein
LPHTLSGFFWNGALRRAEGIYLAAQPAASGSARPIKVIEHCPANVASHRKKSIADAKVDDPVEAIPSI